jgi:hypothetical protein
MSCSCIVDNNDKQSKIIVLKVLRHRCPTTYEIFDEIDGTFRLNLYNFRVPLNSTRSRTALKSSNFGNMWMAPQPEPTQPPKRESSPMPLPMVGLGKDQVR